MRLFLGSDGEQRWLPAGWASLISGAVYSPVIMASHYRAAALGRLLDKLRALVATSQEAIPHRTVGKWSDERAVRTHIFARLRAHNWDVSSSKNRNRRSQQDKH